MIDSDPTTSGSVQENGLADDPIRELRNALQSLMHAYSACLQQGRDRIVNLGGTCDPVEVMKASDPALRAARQVLSKTSDSAWIEVGTVNRLGRSSACLPWHEMAFHPGIDLPAGTVVFAPVPVNKGL